MRMSEQVKDEGVKNVRHRRIKRGWFSLSGEHIGKKMNWEKIDYPWKGINIPDSEIDSRMKLFNDFVTYFGFDRMARAESVGSYERLLCSRILKWRYGRSRRTGISCQRFTSC